MMHDMQVIMDRIRRDSSGVESPAEEGKESPGTTLKHIIDQSGVTLNADYPFQVPLEVKDFWSDARSAILFLDCEFGQWGLKILTPEDALKTTRQVLRERPQDLTAFDLVIAEFIGDSDLLIINCNTSSVDYGCVLVADPIYERSQWIVAAKDFLEFLNEFMEHSGEKYWE